MKLLQILICCSLTTLATVILFPTAIHVAATAPTGVLAFVGAFVMMAIFGNLASE